MRRRILCCNCVLVWLREWWDGESSRRLLGDGSLFWVSLLLRFWLSHASSLLDFYQNYIYPACFTTEISKNQVTLRGRTLLGRGADVSFLPATTLPMASFAPPPSNYRSPSVVSSSHHPPRPLDAPDLFPLLNSLKEDPSFQAALAQHQQTSKSKSKAPSRKPSKRRNASGAASVTSGTAAGRKDEREGWARVPRGGREMRNGDLLAELYRDVGRQKVVSSRSDVGKHRAVESRGKSPAALFARSTGWEGGGSLPTMRSSQRGSTEAPRGLPHTADLFSMLENPPAPILPPQDSVHLARPTRELSQMPSTFSRIR
jgi:hypothetical protein